MEEKALKGRPTIFTGELCDRFFSRLAMGESVRTICKDEDMPSMATIFRWLREKEDFRKQYEVAKQESADALAEELLDIADNGVNDWMEVNHDKDSDNAGWRVNGEAIQRSRLRVDVRKWLMSKQKPKKYGEMIDITSGGEKLPQPILSPILHVPSNDSDKEDSSAE